MADKKISALTPATTPLAGTEVLPIVQGAATVKVATNDLTVKNIRANATTGLLQVSGPAGGATRVMTTPDANFTAARTDAAQTFSGLQVFASPGTGDENIRFTDGTKSGTIQQSDSQTFFNGNISLAAPAIFTWRHTSSYTQLMQLSGATSNLTLNTGNLVLGTAGKGIDFSANGGDVLNQYDEGTFTATLTSTTGTITLNSGQDLMQYTRIGRMVYVSGQIVVSAISSPTGILTLGGLPFTVNGSLGELAGRGAITVVAEGVGITVNSVVGYFLTGGTTANIYKYAAGNTANMAADVTASSSFLINMWYVAA
jgi:hypothetical protein